MSRSVQWKIAVGALCLLGGCASSPRVEYFALEPMQVKTAVAGALPAPIQVAQVHLPPALDRKQMVRHTGSYSLDISDQHRWGAPLDEMILTVLSQDLMRMLPPGSLILPDEPAAPSTRKIVVNVLEFAPDAGGTVQFEGTWSLIAAAGGAPPDSKEVSLSVPAEASDAAAQVKAMSRALERLAESIAQTVQVPR